MGERKRRCSSIPVWRITAVRVTAAAVVAPVSWILDDHARGPPVRQVLGGGHLHTAVSIAWVGGRHGVYDPLLGLNVNRHGLRVTVLNWLLVHVSAVVTVGDWGGMAVWESAPTIKSVIKGSRDQHLVASIEQMRMYL